MILCSVPILFGNALGYGHRINKVYCEESYQKLLPFKLGGKVTIEIRNNGSIRVEGWERKEVKIEATKEARAYTEEEAERKLKKLPIIMSREFFLVESD